MDRHTRRLARELKKQLRAASDRIISFHIIKPTPAMLRLWPVSAPNLKGMAIDTNTPFPALFRGEMPLLRSVVTPILNENQYLMVQNLTSLILYPPYTLEKLLATLKNTPMLRRLELRRISEVGCGDLPQVSLPHLEALYLRGCVHSIVGFISFPSHVHIVIFVPFHLERGVSSREIRAISSFFIPPVFLRSSILEITTREVRSPTEVRIIGQDTGDGHRCYVYIDFEEGLSIERRCDVCLCAMGMVRNMTSVSSLLFNAEAWFPVKCTSLFKRLGGLKVLTLTGPWMYPVFLDVVSAEIDVVPSLERVVLDRRFTPIFQKFKDLVEGQAGRKVVDHLNLAGVDK